MLHSITSTQVSWRNNSQLFVLVEVFSGFPTTTVEAEEWWSKSFDTELICLCTSNCTHYRQTTRVYFSLWSTSDCSVYSSQFFSDACAHGRFYSIPKGGIKQMFCANSLLSATATDFLAKNYGSPYTPTRSDLIAMNSLCV